MTLINQSLITVTKPLNSWIFYLVCYFKSWLAIVNSPIFYLALMIKPLNSWTCLITIIDIINPHMVVNAIKPLNSWTFLITVINPQPVVGTPSTKSLHLPSLGASRCPVRIRSAASTE